MAATGKHARGPEAARKRMGRPPKRHEERVQVLRLRKRDVAAWTPSSANRPETGASAPT